MSKKKQSKGHFIYRFGHFVFKRAFIYDEMARWMSVFICMVLVCDSKGPKFEPDRWLYCVFRLEKFERFTDGESCFLPHYSVLQEQKTSSVGPLRVRGPSRYRRVWSCCISATIRFNWCPVITSKPVADGY